MYALDGTDSFTLHSVCGNQTTRNVAHFGESLRRNYRIKLIPFILVQFVFRNVLVKDEFSYIPEFLWIYLFIFIYLFIYFLLSNLIINKVRKSNIIVIWHGSPRGVLNRPTIFSDSALVNIARHNAVCLAFHDLNDFFFCPAWNILFSLNKLASGRRK